MKVDESLGNVDESLEAQLFTMHRNALAGAWLSIVW